MTGGEEGEGREQEVYIHCQGGGLVKKRVTGLCWDLQGVSDGRAGGGSFLSLPVLSSLASIRCTKEPNNNKLLVFIELYRTLWFDQCGDCLPSASLLI